MTSDGWTWAQAVDPATPAADLAAIAAERADLRPAIAINPATYPELRQWLAGLGDPQVTQALNAAAAASAAQAAAPVDPWAEASATSAPGPVTTYPTSAPAYDSASHAPQPSAPGQAGTSTGTRAPSNAALIGMAVAAVVLLAIGFGLGRASASGNSWGTSGSSYYSACRSGDMSACDQLWYDTPSGSDDEYFAGTCGNRATYESATCVYRFGDQY